MSHCDYCRRGKGRRKLRALLLERPNMTTTRAAQLLDLDRPYANTVRLEMERLGCVSKRTVNGRTQAVGERLAEKEHPQVMKALSGGHAIVAWLRRARPIGALP